MIQIEKTKRAPAPRPAVAAESAEPFFPPTIPSMQQAAETVGSMKRLASRLKGLVQPKESPMDQQAKLEILVSDLQGAMDSGQVKVLAFKADPKWIEQYTSAPYSAKIQIGERVYTIKMRDKLSDWIRDIYRETWTLKSEDGRFQMHFRHYRQYRSYPEKPRTKYFTYRDDLKGVRLSSSAEDIGDGARRFFRDMAELLKRHYEAQRNEAMQQLREGKNKLDF